MDEEAFLRALHTNKIPVLVLDQKWHRLFALNGKPDAVKESEAKVSELLAEQGKLNNDLKELKKLKNHLMQDVVGNMEGAEAKNKSETSAQKLSEDKRLIEETKDRIQECEDRLLDIPNLIKEQNEELMMLTMKFCYDKLRSNSSEVKEITEWITQVRIDLKKNIIKKQNREINNREIYSYMHDIFGKDVVSLFDVKETGEINLGGSDIVGIKEGGSDAEAEDIARQSEAARPKERSEKENIDT